MCNIEKLKNIESIVEKNIDKVLTESIATDIYELTNFLMCEKDKMIVTFFPCDDGHLDVIDISKSEGRVKLIKKFEEECSESGTDWLEDEELSLDDIRTSEYDELMSICESISRRGFLNVVEV